MFLSTTITLSGPQCIGITVKPAQCDNRLCYNLVNVISMIKSQITLNELPNLKVGYCFQFVPENNYFYHFKTDLKKPEVLFQHFIQQ